MEKPNEILGKIAVMFHTYGIKSVTMDDISREMGISKKTLYQHFSDRDDLVKKVVEYTLLIVMEQLGRISSESQNAIEELFEVNRFFHSIIKKYSPSFEYDLKKYFPEIYQGMVSSKRERMYRFILDNILKGKKENIYREELEEETIARLIVSRMENIHENTMFTVEEMTKWKIFREIFIFNIRGIANDKGIQILEENMHKLEYNEVDDILY